MGFEIALIEGRIASGRPNRPKDYPILALPEYRSRLLPRSNVCRVILYIMDRDTLAADVTMRLTKCDVWGHFPRKSFLAFRASTRSPLISPFTKHGSTCSHLTLKSLATPDLSRLVATTLCTRAPASQLKAPSGFPPINVYSNLMYCFGTNAHVKTANDPVRPVAAAGVGAVEGAINQQAGHAAANRRGCCPRPRPCLRRCNTILISSIILLIVSFILMIYPHIGGRPSWYSYFSPCAETSLEIQESFDAELEARIVQDVRRLMSDFAQRDPRQPMKRGQHAKTLACLRGSFKVRQPPFRRGSVHRHFRFHPPSPVLAHCSHFLSLLISLFLAFSTCFASLYFPYDMPINSNI